MAITRKKPNAGQAASDETSDWERETDRPSRKKWEDRVDGYFLLSKNVLFVDANFKVILYALVLVMGSVASDLSSPLPDTYFSRKTNFLNVYFVKVGWAWTGSILGSFMLLATYVYCCGEKAMVRKHMIRLVIATACWYLWTSLFVVIENWTGSCKSGEELEETFAAKGPCVENGHRWVGFDVSGHVFLLIYSCLIIIEEARCMRGWESIGERIRNKPLALKSLTDVQMTELKTSYELLDPYVKGGFVAVTLLSLLWDFMLLITILYFHTMAQKLAGGLIAIATWFVTYRVYYRSEFSPGLPGESVFKYQSVNFKRS